MNIDQTDLSIIRAIENGGKVTLDLIANGLNLNLSIVDSRVKQFEAARLIKNYKASIRIPAFLGGDWILGCALCVTNSPDSAINQIRLEIPYVIEIARNCSIPDDVCPNLSFLYYTNDFPASTKLISNLSELSFVEFYNLRQYHYPIPATLTINDKKLLLELCKNPLISLEDLSLVTGQDIIWVKEKTSRLVANPGNIESDSRVDVGIMQINPEMDWRQCDNFSHIHFLVELGPDNIYPSLPDFQPVLSGKTIRNKFCQLESDLWGIGDLGTKIRHLHNSGVAVKGLIIAESNIIVNHWVPELLE